ncbi:hypothetical protein DSO57_1015590 [Entomophthora muscae]|nr:hypothetical protein DSO57_1015590 [Entomophthora muscae]
MSTVDATEAEFNPHYGESDPKTLPCLYEQSSHFRNWRFSPQKLHEIRSDLHLKAIEKFNSTMELEKLARKKKNSSRVDSATMPLFNEEIADEYLTMEEENLLYQFYENNITLLAKKLDWPVMVKFTAIVYMKRFYLYNTLMDFQISNILLTCLYLACKVENAFIPIDKFVTHIPRLEASTILDLEFRVSQSLKFDFAVIHPYRPLYGIMLDLQRLPFHVSLITEAYQDAIPYLDFSYRTDATFTCLPSQLALAAFRLSATKKGLDFDSYLKVTFGDNHSAITSILDSIQRDIFPGEGPSPYRSDKDRIKRLDRKLIFAREPERNPKNAL